MGSFDAGYGSTHMARLIGQKKAREMWFLARFYCAEEAKEMGLINRIVPVGQDVETALTLARRMASKDRTLIRETKRAVNRTYEIMGMGTALESALEVDMLIEGEGMATKHHFLEIARSDGLRAALKWREERAAEADRE